MTPEAPKDMKAFRPDGKVSRAFCRSTAFAQFIQGPWGSGKTAACVVGKLWNIACSQAPDRDGIRRTRFFIVRNTYTDLKNTTLNTWKDWFPENIYGDITMSRPFKQHIKMGDVDCEVLFLALDDEEDRKKLLSLECTVIYFNEFREIERGIIDDATGRVGRYPGDLYRPDDVPKAEWPTFYGIIGDTNAPAEDHWLPIMRGDVPYPDHFTEEDIQAHIKPDNWEFFMQPPAMIRTYDEDGKLTGYELNPDAENLKYLPVGYYDNMIKGKKPSWIAINVLNELGKLVEGRPVFETFREDYHVSKEKLEVVDGALVYVGVDFGRTPAAVAGQLIGGQWRILYEIQARNMGANRFAPILKKDLAGRFAGCQLAIFGDPAGDDEGQSDDQTPFRVFKANGLRVVKAYHNNKLGIRLEAVENVLGRNNDMNTGPALMIDTDCKILKTAMNGGYQYKRIRVSGSAKYSDVPDKNEYSHIADAFQYLLLGAGEGNIVLTNQKEKPKPQQASRKDSNPFRRNRKSRLGRR